ncbi:MAG: SH3 domain-containing protein [Leptolyngbyaceae cyanobacterium]
MKVLHAASLSGLMIACYLMSHSAALAMEAEIIADTLTVKAGPGGTFDTVDLVFVGDQVEILDQQGDWAQISTANGTSGWVPRDQVLIASESNVIDTNQVDAGASDGTSGGVAYPELVAVIESDCAAPNELITQTDQSPTGEVRSYYCWEPATAETSRRGEWLGTVPTREDPDFGADLACRYEEAACESALAQLESDYAAELSDAILACGSQQGILFLQPLDKTVDIRCGFFATSVYDFDNDGQVDYEDPVSVDISVFVADIEF